MVSKWIKYLFCFTPYARGHAEKEKVEYLRHKKGGEEFWEELYVLMLGLAPHATPTPPSCWQVLAFEKVFYFLLFPAEGGLQARAL